MGGYGPLLGQAHHFLRYNVGKEFYAEERYHKETLRRFGPPPGGQQLVAGDSYTIADMAIYPWTAPATGTRRRSPISSMSIAGMTSSAPARRCRRA